MRWNTSVREKRFQGYRPPLGSSTYAALELIKEEWEMKSMDEVVRRLIREQATRRGKASWIACLDRENKN